MGKLGSYNRANRRAEMRAQKERLELISQVQAILGSNIQQDLKNIGDDLENNVETVKPIIEWLLRNLEELRNQADGLLGDGIAFKDYSIGYPSRCSGPSVVEKYIIGAETCKQIIDSVQRIVDGMDESLFDIVTKYFWDAKPVWLVAKELKAEGTMASERTVARRLKEIYSLIATGLENDGITYYNLYWFRERFRCVNRERKAYRAA